MVSDPQACLSLGFRVGWARFIVIGTLSELVEGRETSQPLPIGRRRGLAKERSITEGRAIPTKGNLVYSSGGLKRAKPASATFGKYGIKEPSPPG